MRVNCGSLNVRNTKDATQTLYNHPGTADDGIYHVHGTWREDTKLLVFLERMQPRSEQMKMVEQPAGEQPLIPGSQEQLLLRMCIKSSCRKSKVLPEPHGPIGRHGSAFLYPLAGHQLRLQDHRASASCGVSVYSPAFTSSCVACMQTSVSRVDGSEPQLSPHPGKDC